MKTLFKKESKALLFIALSIILFGCGSGGGGNSAQSGGGNNVNTSNLPLLKTPALHFQYAGAFKMYPGIMGSSKLGFSLAIFDIDSTHQTFFINSHANVAATCIYNNTVSHAHSVAELKIPPLVKSTRLTDLNTALFVQNFTEMMDFTRVPNHAYHAGAPDCVNLVTGIKYINGKLILNTMSYYDAFGKVTDTTLLLENARDLFNSPRDGFFQVQGAAHTSRWISDIPPEWQAKLGGKYIFGNSNNFPINDRQSLGPTAFVVDINKFSRAASNAGHVLVPSIKLLDYKLTKIKGYTGPGTGQFIGALHPDFFNIKGNNTLWTQKSNAVYGFIIPGTSTYMVVGPSGGHHTRICYKTTYLYTKDPGCISVRTGAEYNALPPAQQAVTQKCGGYCLVNPKDRYNYYWLYNVNDLVKVKNGLLKPGSVKPYEVGRFDVPFQTDISGNPQFHPIASASFDRSKDLLYLSIEKAGAGASPVMVAYQLKRPVR